MAMVVKGKVRCQSDCYEAAKSGFVAKSRGYDAKARANFRARGHPRCPMMKPMRQLYAWIRWRQCLHARSKLPLEVQWHSPFLALAQTRSCSCSASQIPSIRHQNSTTAPQSNPTASPDPPTPNADHRTLGTAQELFISSPYSPGSPIFLPNGTRIINKLTEFLRQQYVVYGFNEVI